MGLNSKGGKAPARRAPYTFEEDKRILRYVSEKGLYKRVKGKVMWQKMALALSIRGEGRTWHSLKERFVKQIIPNLEKYNVEHTLIHHFLEPFKWNRKRTGTSQEKGSERKVLNKVQDEGISNQVHRMKDSSNGEPSKKGPQIIDSDSDSWSAQGTEDFVTRRRKTSRLKALPSETSTDSTPFEAPAAATTECCCSDFEGTQQGEMTPCGSKCKTLVTSAQKSGRECKEQCHRNDLRRDQASSSSDDDDMSGTFIDPLYVYYVKNREALPYIVMNGVKVCLGSLDFPVHPPCFSSIV